MTAIATPRPGSAPLPTTHSGPRRLVRRFLRGRPDDPSWVRPALLSTLTATAVLYIWGLGASGWANSFYTAAVQAGTKSWKAFLFGSFDSSNFITVDKSPAALWVMELSGRIFGFNSWSMLVPEALEGVATVGLVYLTVRRWFPAGAALLAAAVTALTPVAVLMFRFNNPDALMVLLITLAAYSAVRLVEDGGRRWAVMMGGAVGLAFLAKMLQAFLVAPALIVVVLVAAPGPIGRRIRMLLWSGLALVVSAGWWLALVTLTPASDRPYVGGSQNDSIWNLMFGYNGFGRLTGNETGSVGGGAAGSTGRWGATGLTRLFGSEMGTQASWLLPAALVLLVAGLVVTRRAARQNRTRAALLLWGGWLVVTGLVFSLGQGIIHPYYTVALAPAIGGVTGSGLALFWVNRHRPAARAVMGAAVVLTAWWSVVLLRRTPHWMPWLQALVVVAAVAAVATVAFWSRPSVPLRVVGAAAALVACLAAPLAYSLDTAGTAHSGSIPSAGPAGGSSGPGVGGGGPGGAGAPGGLGAGRGFRFGGGQGFTGGGPLAGSNPPSAGQAPPSQSGGNGSFGGAGGPAALGQGGGGGLLDASKPPAALQALLEKGASSYEWVAATVGANDAAGYQISTGEPVMAIGGFNGTDPYPSLSYFEKLVSEKKVHYFIASGAGGGGGFGGGPGGATSSTSSAITSWVESHFEARTVAGVTLYDLTSPTG